LVIYLQAPVESLVARVHRRGNSMEKNISEEYLIRLSEAYTRFFYDYRDSPLLIINSARLNFVDDPAHLELLVARILGMKGQREYFNVA
jgi:deoxyadenosine/deoxycytidine kinase